MTGTNKDGDGTHGYRAPIAWIMVLLAGYWLISEWKSLPILLGTIVGAIH